MAATIAFITTCKGRLHHLQKTLPTTAAQGADELIVVDYGCPDGTGDWVEAHFPQVRVVRASQPDGGFNVSRARNLAAAAASCEWLFFVDADIGMKPGLVATLRGELRPGHYYRPLLKRGSLTGQAYGSFCCRAADFAAVEGYDEVMEGWGYEDRDLYERLTLLGREQAYYHPELLSIIVHDDDERHTMSGMRDRAHNEAVNACYSLAKRTLSSARGGNGNLPLTERRKLMQEVRRIVGEWYAAGAGQPLSVRFLARQSERHRLASQMHMRAQTAVTVVLEPAENQPEPAPPPSAPAKPARRR